jgi:hypothetical protein
MSRTGAGRLRVNHGVARVVQQGRGGWGAEDACQHVRRQACDDPQQHGRAAAVDAGLPPQRVGQGVQGIESLGHGLSPADASAASLEHIIGRFMLRPLSVFREIARGVCGIQRPARRARRTFKFFAGLVRKSHASRRDIFARLDPLDKSAERLKA